ncbi:hypothetical protein PUN28_003873 [Cardiocondyla obscurior]|uniref:Uncharacterized protein n=1 Tax=Cardiocondyla obscurior TaxID=286306 RepID=A0AAW2GML0_9HYME
MHNSRWRAQVATRVVRTMEKPTRRMRDMLVAYYNAVSPNADHARSRVQGASFSSIMVRPGTVIAVSITSAITLIINRVLRNRWLTFSTLRARQLNTENDYPTSLRQANRSPNLREFFRYHRNDSLITNPVRNSLRE